MVRAVMMPALTYKMQGHTFTRGELQQASEPLMHALKHACSLPITFPSTFMVPRLETVHTANNLTLLKRALIAPTPLREITLARIAATEHRMRFPGPMLEILWHVHKGHRRADRKRLLIPALARALHERGVTLGTPGYAESLSADSALPTPRRRYARQRRARR